MSEIILEALKKLDPKNDEHWTTEGLPRLDVLKDLTGSQVTRDALNTAAKGFSRTNTVLEQAPAVTVFAKPTTEQGAAGSVTEGTNQNLKDGEGEGENQTLALVERNEGESYEDFLERKIKAASEIQSAANVALSEARVAFDVACKELDKLIVERDKSSAVTRNNTHVSAIQQYQASQLKQRQAMLEGK